MREKKSKLLNAQWWDAEPQARDEASKCTIEQNMAAFIKHGPRAFSAVYEMLNNGDDRLKREVLRQISDLLINIRYLLGDISLDAVGGKWIFKEAQYFQDEVASWAQSNAPLWLVEFAATEYRVPWLMVNGKPADGFEEWNNRLKWGREIVNQGKSQFSSPQTRNVARVLRSLSRTKKMAAGMLVLAAFNSPEDVKAIRQIAALPPLSRKTKAQWWPLIRNRIKASPGLTATEKRSIRATLDHDTESALINEYLKRCKRAFNGLCPKD